MKTTMYRIFLIVLMGCGVARSQSITLGTMGDSGTDEYKADDNRAGLVWLEQLVRCRDVYVGDWSSSSRGEPRRAGYEYCWARSSATATGDNSFALPKQWVGLANQVRTCAIEYVFLGIGANDFGFTSGIGQYDAIARGNLAGDELDVFIDSVVARIELATDVVSAAGDVRMVIGWIGDFSATPAARGWYPSETQRLRVTEAVNRASERLLAMAGRRGLPAISLSGLGDIAVEVGGITINMAGASDNPRDCFLSDGVHLGTIMEGLVANMFIEAINRAYDANMAPLSDQEILANAGIDDPNPGSGETFFDVTSFVVNPSMTAVPDFNQDRIIDLGDLMVLGRFWQVIEPKIDVGPLPYGNGIVDMYDFAALAADWSVEVLPEYWVKGEDLIAHWSLDEEAGQTAKERLQGNDDRLHGDPVWLPEGGKVGGAIELDGFDDYISTSVTFNPGHPFSIFAWIKGHKPGGVIISQLPGFDNSRASWLATDPLDGRLTTTVTSGGRSIITHTLASSVVVTDGKWHHVGIAWDGSHRHLYVDKTEIVADSLAEQIATGEGLNIGAGDSLAPENSWDGLIDDVRIFGQAVVP